MTSSAVYATADQIKVQIEKSNLQQDSILGVLAAAASRAIDNYCNRPDGFVALDTATARVFNGSGKRYMLINECVQVTLVEVKESVTDTTYNSWAATDWIAFTGDPAMPDYNRTPYNWIKSLSSGNYFIFSRSSEPTVRVTAKWGYAVSCPAVITEACVIQAARWYNRGRSMWADGVQLEGFGGVAMFRQGLDKDMQFLLEAGRLRRVTTP